MHDTPYKRQTEEITLPLSQRTAVITEGDGYSERLLLKKGKKLYEVVFEYLASLTLKLDDKKPTSADIRSLLLPDQEYLAIQCYKLNYGEMFEFAYQCPACGHNEDRGVNLNDLEFVNWPPEFGPVSPDPVVTLELPKSKKKVVLGLLNGEKEKVLLDQAATGAIDVNQATFQSVRSLGGTTEFSYEDVISLPLADHRAIRKTRRKMSFGLDTTAAITCSNCNNVTHFNILTHSDFLLPGG